MSEKLTISIICLRLVKNIRVSNCFFKVCLKQGEKQRTLLGKVGIVIMEGREEAEVPSDFFTSVLFNKVAQHSACRG